MMKYDVIGKNSALYRKLRHMLANVGKEFSHHEINNNKFRNPIVFAFNKNSVEENIKFLKKIINSSTGKIIYISTTAIYSNQLTKGYKYPRIKKEIENYLIQFDNIHIVRAGMIESFFDLSKFNGNLKYTSLEILCKSIEELINGNISNKITEAWEILTSESSSPTRRITFLILNFLKKFFKSNFYFTRPIDLVFKILGEENYGYTFISNQFESYTENIVVGSGMAALGVLEAIDDQNKLHKSRLIHAKTSKIFFSEESSPKKPIETLQNGGNSNIWHSVISYFSNKKYLKNKFDFFFDKYFPNSIRALQKSSYSFVPYFPIRPLKKINKKKKKLNQVLDDVIIHIEKNEKGLILVHGLKSSYSTHNLFLCTGAMSSIKLLTSSCILKTTKSTLSEHLVGYFGQFSGSFIKSKTIRTYDGHFKKHHQINLENRSLYVTLRPANFSFKNIKKANQFRNFFGRSSKSIFISLISKLNLALIFEALYNKFGLDLNISGKYNIVGHIESKNSVHINCSPFKNPSILYSEKEIIFSNKEIKSIKNYLKNIGVGSNIIINEKTLVSPGLHFLNSSLRDELQNLPKGIKFFGTIIFEDESPKHPTFDLLAYSYQQTVDILKNQKKY